MTWLKQVFAKGTKAKARTSYRLLLLDSYSSYLTPEFKEYYDRKKILFLVFPSHSTYSLQPLDVVMFSPLALSYS
jgi:hypothetical protein